MKTIYKYIEFKKNPNSSWSCLNRKSKHRLVLIDYYKPWQQYCVIDCESDCVFSEDCLADIADFLGQLNSQRAGEG